VAILLNMWGGKIIKKILVGFFFVLFIMSTPGVFAENGFKSIEEFSQWVTFYYQNPEPQRIIDAIKYFTLSPAYDSNAQVPMAYFFASVLKDNKSQINSIFDEIALNKNENAKAMLLNALWEINSIESRNLISRAQKEWTEPGLKNFIQKLLENEPADLTMDPITDAVMLDMLWSAFDATGADWPIQRIISVIELEKTGHGMDIAIGGAANWSLTSNSRQHKKVCQICEKELPLQSGITKEMLKKIVEECVSKY